MRKHIAFKPSEKNPYFAGYHIQYHAGKYNQQMLLYSAQKVPHLREEFLGELTNNLFKIFFVLERARSYQRITILVNGNGSLSVSICGITLTVNPKAPYLILINKILRLYAKAVRAQIKQKQQQFLAYATRHHALPPVSETFSQRERSMYALGWVKRAGEVVPFTNMLLAEPHDIQQLCVHDLDDIKQQFDKTVGAFATTPRGKI